MKSELVTNVYEEMHRIGREAYFEGKEDGKKEVLKLLLQYLSSDRWDFESKEKLLKEIKEL
jgi:hypothetical protein